MGKTFMEKEALQSPDVVLQQLQANREVICRLAERYAQSPPQLVVTCARGSSDHAATYAKYLFEVKLGIPVMSLGPSIGSVYGRPMQLEKCLFIVVSQSGQSPDLVSCASWAKENGAYVVALINEKNTPLHNIADLAIPLNAGKEKSVAATKSYIASLSAIAQIVATMANDTVFSDALDHLPKDLKNACHLDWNEAMVPLASSDDLLVVGRGLGYGIALEAALKFKETSAIHAEGFSSAELMHGPLALVRKRYPILVFNQNDETGMETKKLVENLREKGARVFVVEEGTAQKGRLAMLADMHPYLAPIAMIQRFYLLVNGIALARGFDPDRPDHLKKVTETR